MAVTNSGANPDPQRPPSTETQGQAGGQSSKEIRDQAGGKQRHFSRIWSYLFCFLLGLLLSFAFTLFLTYRDGKPIVVIQFTGFSENLTQDIRAIISILIFGAFGGLLYSLRERKMELPYISQNASPATTGKLSGNQPAASTGEGFKGEIINLGMS